MIEGLKLLRAVRLRGVTLIEAVLYISIALALIVGGLCFTGRRPLHPISPPRIVCCRRLWWRRASLHAIFQNQSFHQ